MEAQNKLSLLINNAKTSDAARFPQHLLEARPVPVETLLNITIIAKTMWCHVMSQRTC
ncbi:uncharacterized protein LOC119160846 isoform X3 [Rhipicephalus microplus]|uniref:uncharacterized protein LOC119160846 isoform X3 n=1 Tax=Rhipicephalus microplus TaxID=6941 RepID=UPI003F6B54AE